LQDPEGFIESGGWSFLDADQSDSEEEGEDEESDFAPRWAGVEGVKRGGGKGSRHGVTEPGAM
jgi:hypothetical protein